MLRMSAWCRTRYSSRSTWRQPRTCCRPREAGARRFVPTSTTALYGHAVVAGGCRWIDEDTEPLPRTIYHRTKLQAETLAEAAATPGFSVRVLRMGRCFRNRPSAWRYLRLHRGIDARDVASAHAALLLDEGARFARYLARTDAVPARGLPELATHPRSVLAVARRSCWPSSNAVAGRAIEHRPCHDSARLRSELGWQPCFGPDDVLQQYAVGSIEVLPRAQWIKDRVAE